MPTCRQRLVAWLLLLLLPPEWCELLWDTCPTGEYPLSSRRDTVSFFGMRSTCETCPKHGAERLYMLETSRKDNQPTCTLNSLGNRSSSASSPPYWSRICASTLLPMRNRSVFASWTCVHAKSQVMFQQRQIVTQVRCKVSHENRSKNSHIILHYDVTHIPP